MKEDPPLDAKCRDKFLVQSVAITPERDLGSITAIVSAACFAFGSQLTTDAVAKRGKHCERRSRREENSRCVPAGRWRHRDSTQTGQWNGELVALTLTASH